MRFLRFVRLLRVFKLKKLLYKFEEIIVSDIIQALIGFLKMVTIILFIAHWIGCIFFYIGANEFESNPDCWIVAAEIHDSPVID
jgi:fatty-acid desaturase